MAMAISLLELLLLLLESTCGEVDLLVSSEEVVMVSVRFTVVLSCMLALLLSLPPESCLMKYF